MKSNLNIVLLSAFIGAMIVGSTLLPTTLAWGQVYNKNPNAFIDVSPPFQYLTADTPNNDIDMSIDMLSAMGWGSVGCCPDYTINTAGHSGTLTDTQINTLIENAEETWFTTLDPLTDNLKRLDFSGAPSDGLKPSAFFAECYGGVNTFDGDNEIGFCEVGGIAQASVRLSPSWRNGVFFDVEEADMIFDEDVLWMDSTTDPRDLQGMATHEFGHWYTLGDLYDLYTGAPMTCETTSQGKEDPVPVMCLQQRSVTIPDQNGIKQIYADHHSNDLTQTSTSWTVKGGDIAMAKVNTTSSTNNLQDLMFVFAENDGTSSNLRAEFEWDLSTDGGNGGNGAAVTLQSGITGKIYEVGATLELIDADVYPDLILSYTLENPTGTFRTYHQIWKDIVRSTTSSSSAFTFSGSTSAVEVGSAFNSRGVDSFVWDINGGGRDVVLAVTKNVSGQWKLFFYYSTLFSDFTIGAWHSIPSNGNKIVAEDEIGAALYDGPKRLVSVGFLSGSGYDQYILHFTSTTIDYDQLKNGPLLDTNIIQHGAGVAEARNIGGVSGQNYPDNVYAFFHLDDVIYLIEWDGRLNSHP